MGKMPILKTIKKIPGGLMIVPLFIGAIINTFFPQFLTIGGFTTSLFKDAAIPMLALFVMCNGAQIDVKSAGVPLWRGFALCLVKVGLGALIGWGVGKIWGVTGVLGLSPLAIVGAMTNSNSGVYASLAGQYGDSSDVSAVTILSLNDGPFFTMLVFGLTGLANIPFLTLAATLIPALIGFALGNLDSDMRDFLKAGLVITIPAASFPLGASLNLFSALEAGLSGVLLGVMVLVISGLGGYLAGFIIYGRPRAIGAAIGTAAGNAVATPMALAATDSSLQALAEQATPQIAAACLITAIGCPLLVSFLSRFDKDKQV